MTVSDRVAKELYEDFDGALFPAVDLILSCGDLPPEYLSFLTASLNAPLYYVNGNHDIRNRSKPPAGCTNLHGKVVQAGGLNILGLEGARWYNGGPFQYSEARMRKIIRSLRGKIWRRGGIDIVLTHAPPRHIHDADDRCHRGFDSFRWLIDKYTPRYFIHGHIHAVFANPSERVTIVDKTAVINSYGHYLLEIDDEKLVE